MEKFTSSMRGCGYPWDIIQNTQICIVRHQQEGNDKHVCAHVLFPNYTDFPELVIAVKNKSCERIQTASLVCPAHHVLLYITAIENRRARTRLHCPTCKVTRSFESPSGFNSETLAKQGMAASFIVTFRDGSWLLYQLKKKERYLMFQYSVS